MKSLLSSMLLGVSLLVATSAHADHPAHPIDAWHDALMAKTDGSVPAMINVESAATVRWDRELNSVYRRVLAKLNPAGQQSLRNSQRKWLAWRNAEVKFQNDIWASAFAGPPGNLDVFIQVQNETHLVRQRVLDLVDDEESLTTHP